MDKMKLEIGMYVRLINLKGIHFFGKIVSINEFREPSVKYGVDLGLEDLVFIGDEDILKSSYDILELINVGDVVAIKEDIDKFNKTFVLGIFNLELLKQIKDKLIKNELRLIQVMTKEKFEQNCYKIGE